MSDPTVRILHGHVLDALRGLPDGTVQAVVTSPPYWGLRDYARCECVSLPASNFANTTMTGGMPQQQDARHRHDADPDCRLCRGTGRDESLTVIWGSVDGCEHEWGPLGRPHHRGQVAQTIGAAAGPAEGQASPTGQFCARCGAWRGQLGLEPTPELYADHLVGIFREVRRVLRDDGTLWLNMGDCYATTPVGTFNGGGFRDASARTGGRDLSGVETSGVLNKLAASGLKPKDLVGLPWRIAFALQADGWWLRSDPVWSKPNPMPESVDGWRWERHMLDKTSYTVDGKRKRVRVRERIMERRVNLAGETVDVPGVGDEVPCPGCDACSANGGLVLKRDSWRPTKAHEYVFMLAKSETYFADADAVREPFTGSTIQRLSQRTFWDQEGGPKDGVNPNRSMRRAVENLARKWNKNPSGWDTSSVGHRERAGRYDYTVKDPGGVIAEGRNLRTVWTIATEAYPEAHFATFPTKLVEPCVKASTSEAGCCAVCGAPWARIVDRAPFPARTVSAGGKQVEQDPHFSHRRIAEARNAARAAGMGHDGYFHSPRSVGFRRTCDHEGEPVPCAVLDPFGGSGTVGEVAKALGRSAILIEIKGEYVRLAERRVDSAQRNLASFGDKQGGGSP